MAFNGYLVKIGEYEFPMNHIIEKSYTAKVNTLEENTENDSAGYLHRGAILQRVPKVSFKTLPITDSELDAIRRGMRTNYTIPEERKANCSVWIPEWGEYVEQEMYVSDTDYNIDYVVGNEIYYDSIQFTLTGYGER